MDVLQNVFNNRKIAIGFWGTVSVILLIWTKPAREFLKIVLPILFCKKFVVLYVVTFKVLKYGKL